MKKFCLESLKNGIIVLQMMCMKKCGKTHRIFITNLGKCTQIDARPLSDEIFR